MHRSILMAALKILPMLMLLLSQALPPGNAAAATLKSGEFSPARQAPAFTLQGSTGKPLSLSDYRGKVVALGFGFTSCPEVCPTTLAELAAAKKKLGVAGNELQVLYITVDPERDPPEVMRAYLSGFDPSFVGATGTPAQLAAINREYGISAKKVSIGAGGKNYGINHSSFVYLIDRQGKLRALSPYGRPVDDLVHDVRALLK